MTRGIDFAGAGQRPIGMEEVVRAAPAAVGPAHRSDVRLRAMIDAHFDLVWRTLRRLGVEVEGVDDATQQVFMVASRKLDVIEPGGERRYLIGIAVRVAADARRTRRRRREVQDDDDERADAAPLQDDLLDRKRARELLDTVLATLPTNLRTAFVLFELEAMSAPEVAAVLSIPLGTATSRLRRAREAFRERVEAMTAARGGFHE